MFVTDSVFFVWAAVFRTRDGMYDFFVFEFLFIYIYIQYVFMIIFVFQITRMYYCTYIYS